MFSVVYKEQITNQFIENGSVLAQTFYPGAGSPITSWDKMEDEKNFIRLDFVAIYQIECYLYTNLSCSDTNVTTFLLSVRTCLFHN